MPVFCDALIFLALTLLAVILAIFVVAVSFLGRAIEQSSSMEAELGAQKQAELEKTIQDVTKRLNQAKSSGKGIDEAREELEKYNKTKKEIEKKTERASSRYKLLTARQGVLYPGAVLLASIAFLGVGKVLGDISGTTALVFSYVLPILAAIGLIWVCYQAYRSLTVVQGVAMLPEDVYLKRMVDALEVSMQRQEDKKRPQLTCKLDGVTPPLKFKPGDEVLIWFRVVLTRGEVGRSSQIALIAPKDFEFVEPEAKHRPDGESDFPNTLEAKIVLGNILGGIYYRNAFKMKTPNKPGLYHLAYAIICEGFTSGLQAFDVEVAA